MTQVNSTNSILRKFAPVIGGRNGAGLMLVLLMASGCVQEMANQPRVDVMEPSPFEFLTPENRTPVPGTISRGQNFANTPVNTGREGNELVAKIPIPVTEELLKRGQERYNIFCKYCHGDSGSGDGLVVQRGFPAPPSYHIERIQNTTDGHLYVTIKDGLGRMPRFGNRISVDDRWAIVAYLRALQVSQNATGSELSPSDLEHLK